MPDIELSRREFRRVKPKRDRVAIALILAGIWAGIVIGFARAYHSDAPITVAIVSLLPGAILFGLAILRD